MTQSHIGWYNFLKDRISREWITYIRHNEENSNGHGKSQDWSSKFIGGLWEHLKRLRQFVKDIYHQDNERTIGEIMGKTHRTAPETLGLSKKHFDRRQRIMDLQYESKK
jgi:hypothetical protein